MPLILSTALSPLLHSLLRPKSLPWQTMEEAVYFPSTTTADHRRCILPPKPLPRRPPILHLRPPSSAPKTSLVSPKPSPPPLAGNLQEKLIYLDSFGIDLIPLLTTHPPLLSATLSDLKSTVDFLSAAVPLPPPALRRLIHICPDLLTFPLPSITAAITFLLREAHVHKDHLRHAIHRRPRLLTSHVKTRLRPTLYFLQGTIGIAEINKHTHLLSSSVEDKLLPRIEFFHERIGIPYSDTISMFRRFPSLFCYSIKDNIEPKLNYLVLEMGRDLKELVEFPQYFSYSLKNRINDRHQQCVEKGVCFSLPAMLRSSERRFRERMEMCCSSSIPARTSPLWFCTRSIDRDNVLVAVSVVFFFGWSSWSWFVSIFFRWHN